MENIEHPENSPNTQNIINDGISNQINAAPIPVKNKSHKALIISIITIIILGIAAFVVFFVINKNSEESSNPVPTSEQPANNDMHGILQYIYSDDNAPTTTYDIKLDFDTKILYATETTCGALADGDFCNQSGNKDGMELSDDELKMIWWFINKEGNEILKDQIGNVQNNVYDDTFLVESLSSLLTSVIRDDEVMANKEEDTEYWDSLYSEDDLNGDGIVTYREFGDHWLGEDIIEDYIIEDKWINCMPSLTGDDAIICKAAEMINYDKIAY